MDRLVLQTGPKRFCWVGQIGCVKHDADCAKKKLLVRGVIIDQQQKKHVARMGTQMTQIYNKYNCELCNHCNYNAMQIFQPIDEKY